VILNLEALEAYIEVALERLHGIRPRRKSILAGESAKFKGLEELKALRNDKILNWQEKAKYVIFEMETYIAECMIYIGNVIKVGSQGYSGDPKILKFTTATNAGATNTKRTKFESEVNQDKFYSFPHIHTHT